MTALPADTLPGPGMGNYGINGELSGEVGGGKTSFMVASTTKGECAEPPLTKNVILNGMTDRASNTTFEVALYPMKKKEKKNEAWEVVSKEVKEVTKEEVEIVVSEVKAQNRRIDPQLPHTDRQDRPHHHQHTFKTLRHAGTPSRRNAGTKTNKIVVVTIVGTTIPGVTVLVLVVGTGPANLGVSS